MRRSEHLAAARSLHPFRLAAIAYTVALGSQAKYRTGENHAGTAALERHYFAEAVVPLRNSLPLSQVFWFGKLWINAEMSVAAVY